MRPHHQMRNRKPHVRIISWVPGNTSASCYRNKEISTFDFIIGVGKVSVRSSALDPIALPFARECMAGSQRPCVNMISEHVKGCSVGIPANISIDFFWFFFLNNEDELTDYVQYSVLGQSQLVHEHITSFGVPSAVERIQFRRDVIQRLVRVEKLQISLYIPCIVYFKNTGFHPESPPCWVKISSHTLSLTDCALSAGHIASSSQQSIVFSRRNRGSTA